MNERDDDSDIPIDQEDYYLDNESYVMEFVEDLTDSEDEEVVNKVKAHVEESITWSEAHKQPNATNIDGRTIHTSIIFQIGDKNGDGKST